MYVWTPKQSQIKNQTKLLDLALMNALPVYVHHLWLYAPLPHRYKHNLSTCTTCDCTPPYLTDINIICLRVSHITYQQHGPHVNQFYMTHLFTSTCTICPYVQLPKKYKYRLFTCIINQHHVPHLYQVYMAHLSTSTIFLYAPGAPV